MEIKFMFITNIVGIGVLFSNYGSLNNVLSNDSLDFGILENKINIFPNPTSDILHIEIPNQSIQKIDVYDITGKHLKEFITADIDMSNLKQGIYYIKISTKSNLILHSKVIKN